MGLKDEHFRREHLWRTIRLALDEAQKEAGEAARLGSCAAADCTMHGLHHKRSETTSDPSGFGAAELSAAESLLREVDAQRAAPAAGNRQSAEHEMWVQRMVAGAVAKIEELDLRQKDLMQKDLGQEDLGQEDRAAVARELTSDTVPEWQLPATPQPVPASRSKGKSIAAAAAAIVTTPKLLLASSAAATALTFAASYHTYTASTLPFDQALAEVTKPRAEMQSRRTALGRVYMDVAESILVLDDLTISPQDTAGFAADIRTELARWGAASSHDAGGVRVIPWASGATKLMTTPFVQLVECAQDDSQSLAERHSAIRALARRAAIGIANLVDVRDGGEHAELIEMSNRQLSRVIGLLTR
ncbi:MAG: hypothetical protein AB8H80_17995 [Planctomycetota bacterium]